MTEYEQRVLRDLSVMKSQMEQLLGIGQPGRLHLIEKRVECNEQMVQRLKGLAGAFGAALMLAHLAIALFANRHG